MEQTAIEHFTSWSPEQQAQFIEALRKEQSHRGAPVYGAIMSWLYTVNQSTGPFYPRQKEADFNATIEETGNFLQWLKAVRLFKLPDAPIEELQDQIDALLNTQESRGYLNMVTNGDPATWPWFVHVPIIQLTNTKSQNLCQTCWTLNKDENENFYIIFEDKSKTETETFRHFHMY